MWVIVVSTITTCAEAIFRVKSFKSDNSPSQDSNHPDDLFQSRKDLPLGVHVVAETLNLEISRCHLVDYVEEFC